MAQVQHYGTGKRKTSVARVFLRPGKGDATVNGRLIDEYFTTVNQRNLVREPFLAIESADSFDHVHHRQGRGLVGGRRAPCDTALPRPWLDYDPELRGVLKEQGFLTRDARKKRATRSSGQRGARARFQFSKR